jgi:hypothetical protein
MVDRDMNTSIHKTRASYNSGIAHALCPTPPTEFVRVQTRGQKYSAPKRVLSETPSTILTDSGQYHKDHTSRARMYIATSDDIGLPDETSPGLFGLSNEFPEVTTAPADIPVVSDTTNGLPGLSDNLPVTSTPSTHQTRVQDPPPIPERRSGRDKKHPSRFRDYVLTGAGGV